MRILLALVHPGTILHQLYILLLYQLLSLPLLLNSHARAFLRFLLNFLFLGGVYVFGLGSNDRGESRAVGVLEL
jgi:hypothetical protein